MKKLLIILLIPYILSCSKSGKNESVTFTDIKNYTINSVKAGSLIKEELKEKNILILNYPQYVSESYVLIRFITAIMASNTNLTVVYPGLPDSIEEKPYIDIIREEFPLLGFNEFLELYNFMGEYSVNFTGTIPLTEDRVLILAPANDYDRIQEMTYKVYEKENIIKVVMAGSKYTLESHNIIKELPIVKKISSIPLIDNLFDIMIITGEVENYTPIQPIKLFTEENYTVAPESFLEENKSIIESLQLKKMNNYLPKLIDKSFNELGE